MIDKFDRYISNPKFGNRTKCGEYANYILCICNSAIQYIDYILSNSNVAYKKELEEMAEYMDSSIAYINYVVEHYNSIES